MESDILTLQAVAEYLKVDERTVYRMVKSKQLPAFKVRNQWRFKKEAIDNWIEKSHIGNNKSNKIEVPIIGKVSAGQPILAEENIEGSLSVDSSLIKNPDFVLVRQQPIAEQGEMVIALIEDEATVKRFYKDKGKIKLQPENDTMKPIIVDPSDKSIMIIGKVEGVIRKI